MLLLSATRNYAVKTVAFIARLFLLLFLQWMRTEAAKIKIKNIMKYLILKSSLMRSTHFNVM